MAGIYIHIPFCKQKCHYCNFYSIASLKQKEPTIKAIIQEINLRKDYLQDKSINTIYFGGGTPSVLSRAEIFQILDAIYLQYDVDDLAEITFEANPDDLNETNLNEFKRSPINRFSMGIQSFHDDDLHYLNRSHSGKDAINAVKRAQDAGFHNLSLDLIYGIPGLTEEKWSKNLATFFSLGAPHLSAYSLTVEPKTALDKLIHKGKLPNVNEEESVTHFEMLLDAIAEHNFLHYEISNFCKPGHYSRHNKNYWNGTQYLGVGPSAHSFDGTSRQWNYAHIKNYIEGVSHTGDFYEREDIALHDAYNEYVMTSLRTMWGTNLDHIKKQFGEKALQYFIKEAKGILDRSFGSIENNHLILNDTGKLMADGLAADLFMDE